MAETAKNETINSLAKSISELTSANVKLTATFKKLTTQIETALNQNRNRNRNNNNKAHYNQNNSNNPQKWPSWCNPDAYCSTCGYKLIKGHDSGNCLRSKDNTDHKKKAKRHNTILGRTFNAGFGNPPNGK